MIDEENENKSNTNEMVNIANNYLNNQDSNNQNDSEPRSPERIDELLEELEEYWKNSPDLRIGQIISNIGQQNGFGDDPFYMEDEVVLRELKNRNEE